MPKTKESGVTFDMRREELVMACVKDWQAGKLTSNAAMMVITIILTPQKPSKECTEWAKKVFREVYNEGTLELCKELGVLQNKMC